MKAVFLALVASFVWGVAPVIFKTGLGGRTDIAVALVVHNLSAFLVSLIYLLLAGTWSVAPRELVFLLLGGAFSGFLGMFFFFHAVKEGEVSVVAPIASISPPVGLYPRLLTPGRKDNSFTPFGCSSYSDGYGPLGSVF